MPTPILMNHRRGSGTVTPPPPPPPPSGRKWWQKLWVADSAGKLVSPRTGRPFNGGAHRFDASSQITAYQNYMGAKPDMYAGPAPKTSHPPSWDTIFGGSWDLGNQAWNSGSTPSLDDKSITAGKTDKQAWLCLNMALFVELISWADFKAIGDGTLTYQNRNIKDWYKRLGARLRYSIETVHGRDPDLVVIRPCRESTNSDTSFVPRNPDGSEGQLYLTGRRYESSDAAITAIWNRAMRTAIKAIQEGYGSHIAGRLPFAFSPAMSTGGPIPHIPYIEFVKGDAADLYDIFCFSFHPGPNRLGDPNSATNARNLVYGTSGSVYSPQVVWEAARDRSAAESNRLICVSTLESGAQWEENRIGGGKDMSRYGECYNHLFDWIATKSNFGFHNIFDDSSIQENFAFRNDNGVLYANDEQKAEWAAYVKVLKARQGKISGWNGGTIITETELPTPVRTIDVANITELRTAATNAAAGTHIRLAAGTYTGNVTLTGTGTSTNPIFITRQPGATVTFNGILTLDAPFAGVHRLEFNRLGRQVVCKRQGFRVLRCLLSGGLPAAATGSDLGKVYLSGGSHPDGLIDGNEFRDIVGDAIRTDDLTSAAGLKNLVISNNHYNGHTVTSILESESVITLLESPLTGSADIVIRGNLFEDCMKDPNNVSNQDELITVKHSGVTLEGNTVITSNGAVFNLREATNCKVLRNWFENGSHVRTYGDDHEVADNYSTGRVLAIARGTSLFTDPNPSQCTTLAAWPKLGNVPARWTGSRCVGTHPASRRITARNNTGEIEVGGTGPGLDPALATVSARDITLTGQLACLRVSGGFQNLSETTGTPTRVAVKLTASAVGRNY